MILSATERQDAQEDVEPPKPAVQEPAPKVIVSVAPPSKPTDITSSTTLAPSGLILPVLVFACNRAAAVTQALEDLIRLALRLQVRGGSILLGRRKYYAPG